MFTFVISVVIIFIAVDLLVRFLIEPLIMGKFKKAPKSSISKLDPSFKLATETMYDGGEAHRPEVPNNEVNDEENLKDEVKSKIN
jgi:hypothetical protein